MNITVEQTLEMPNAVLFVRELEAALEAEQEKRKQFYEEIDEDRKMEFINGEVYFQSPAKYWHTQVVANLSGLMLAHVRARQLGTVATEKMLISLSRNDYEPDLCFFKNEKSITFRKDQMQFPAPDLVVEVLSDSTEKRDRGVKFDDYAAHGIQEYWIIDPKTEIVEQYTLVDENFELLLKANEGTLKSVAVEHFAIPIRAIFDGDLIPAALRTLIAE
jgi:Uma2 family endonuclease